MREYLTSRMAAAFPDADLDEYARARAVDLMLKIRALRELQARGGDPDRTEWALRDELHDAEMELQELTGFGVAELLEVISGPESHRALRPHEAAKVLEGEERKRFIDEMARELGVTEPGSVEVFEDGEWRER